MDALKYNGQIYGEDMDLKMYRQAGQMLNDVLNLSNILETHSKTSFMEGFFSPVETEKTIMFICNAFNKQPVDLDIQYKPISVVLSEDNDDSNEKTKARYNFNFFHITDKATGISDLLLACLDATKNMNCILYNLDGKLTYLRDTTADSLAAIFNDHFSFLNIPGVLFKSPDKVEALSDTQKEYYKSRFATDFLLDKIGSQYIVVGHDDMKDILSEEGSSINIAEDLVSTLVELFTVEDRVVCAKLSDLDFSITGIYTVGFSEFNPEVDTAIVIFDDTRVNSVTPISGSIPKCISTEMMKESFTIHETSILFKEGATARRAKRMGRDIKKGAKRGLGKVLGLPASALKVIFGLKGQVETVLTELRHTRDKHIRKQLSEDRYILIFGKFLTTVLGLVVAGTLVSTAGLTWIAGITAGLIVKFLADYNDDRTRGVGLRLIRDQLELVEMQIQHADANGDKKAVYSLKIYEQSLKARLVRNKIRNLI